MPSAVNSLISSSRSPIEYLRNHPAWVLLISAFVFQLLGWTQDGLNVDSTTYAVIARNMAEHGSWLSPAYTPYYAPNFAEHPPLVMWVQGIIFLFFGASDSTARIFGQLCSVGSVMIVYLLGKEAAGRGYGFLAGLILLLTYNYMKIGNGAMLDVPMIFFGFVVLWSLARIHNGRTDLRTYAVAGAALGLSFLTKGVVSGPFWIAWLAAFFFLIGGRRHIAKLWLIPAIAAVIVIVYLLLDGLFNSSQFTRHYFLVQIWRSVKGAGLEHKAEWYQFILRFIELYLPFVLLLPVGIYLILRRSMTILYPAIIALVFYFLFQSASGKLYYHYFCPAYALSAPLAALPLSLILKEIGINRIATWFLLIWLLLAAIVTASGVRIHEIRSPEIYELSETMNNLLEGRRSRDGLMIGPGRPKWDYVAKAVWYWRSDVYQVPDIETAARRLAISDRFVYVLLKRQDELSTERQADCGLQKFAENDKLVIYVPASP
ncbi:MAG: glycosyltransferase family 39 protein [Candidatus Zixiibacteriota bacterium]|nr:MAG: glycosyltransferase family 39 protein [candidate division Zixibacteria bacterium]